MHSIFPRIYLDCKCLLFVISFTRIVRYWWICQQLLPAFWDYRSFSMTSILIPLVLRLELNFLSYVTN